MIATLGERYQRLRFNSSLLAGLFLLVVLVDLLNMEPQSGVAIPLAVRELGVFVLVGTTVLAIAVSRTLGLFATAFVLLTQSSIPLFNYETFVSVYTYEILPTIDFVDVLFLTLFAGVCWDIRRNDGIIETADVRPFRSVIVLGFFVLLWLIYGLILNGFVRYAAQDLISYIYLFGFAFIGLFTDADAEDIIQFVLFVAFIGAFKATLNFIKFVIQLGRPYGGTVRVVFGGEPHLYLFSILALLTLVLVNRSENHPLTITNPEVTYIPLGGAAMFLIVNPSRLTWLVAITLGIIYVVVLDIERKWKLSFAAIVALGTVALTVTLSVIFPGAIRHISYQVSTLVTPSYWSLEFGATGNSLATRVAEFVNIIKRLLVNKTLFFGEGLGSWWTETYYPIPVERSGTSTPGGNYQIGVTRHRGTHFPISYTLLKFGIFGSTLYWSLWAVISFEIKQFGDRLTTIEYSALLSIALIIPALLATRFLTYRLFLGLLVGLALSLYAQRLTEQES
jgi:hypothetical protein